MRIEIITPCSRWENIILMDKTIPEEIRWHICFDSDNCEFIPNGSLEIGGGQWGNAQRNEALKGITAKRSWVYCLDDDNLLHPDLLKIIKGRELLRYNLITFDQQLEDGTIRKGDNPTRTNIDQAQFLIRRSIHEPYEQEHDADGILIEKLVKKYPDQWLYIPKVLCYYNRLKWHN